MVKQNLLRCSYLKKCLIEEELLSMCQFEVCVNVLSVFDRGNLLTVLVGLKSCADQNRF